MRGSRTINTSSGTRTPRAYDEELTTTQNYGGALAKGLIAGSILAFLGYMVTKKS